MTIQILNATSINSNDNLMDNNNNNNINIDDNHFLILQNKNQHNNQYKINRNFIMNNLNKLKKNHINKYENIKKDIKDIKEILNQTQSISLNKSIKLLSSLTTKTATTTTTTVTRKNTASTTVEQQQRLRQRRQLLSEIIIDKNNKLNKINTPNIIQSSLTNNNSNIDNSNNIGNGITNNNIINGSNNSISSKFQQNFIKTNNKTTDNDANNIISSMNISSTSTTYTPSTITSINTTSNPSSSLIGHYIAGGTVTDHSGHNGGVGNGVIRNDGGGTITIPTTHTNRIAGTGTNAIITNGKRPTIIIYPTVSPESIVIPIVSCILGFPLLALMVICCLRRRAKLARERDRRRNYDMQDHAVSLVRFSPIHRLNNRSSRVISLRPERSLSRGFPSLELDTVVEERSSDHEQTQTDILSPESPSDPHQKYRGFNCS